MALKVDLSCFLDEEGHMLELTEQAEMIFNFLTEIVLFVSENIEQPIIFLDLKCNAMLELKSCLVTEKLKQGMQPI